MFRPVLAIFRLSQVNLRSYYKHTRARGVEISTYGPYEQKQNQDRNQIKTTQHKNRYRKIKRLWGCARQVCSSVVVRRPVLRPS
jgi:hypothetical protein